MLDVRKADGSRADFAVIADIHIFNHFFLPKPENSE
jgi:hypothetical protein